MTILKVNSIRKTTSSAYDILQKQRFVLVQDKNDWGKEWSTGVGFDLKDKELYNSYFAVIEKNKLYGGYGNYGTKEMYQRSFNREISSILVNLKISPDEIKRIIIKLHAHQILLVNKELLKEEYPPEFEGRYSIKDSQFSKVRITYNKRILTDKKLSGIIRVKEG